MNIEVRERLLEYLLGAMEAEEVTLIEQTLAADGDARGELELLQMAIARLEPLCQQADAPDGLARRTCQRIRELHGT